MLIGRGVVTMQRRGHADSLTDAVPAVGRVSRRPRRECIGVNIIAAKSMRRYVERRPHEHPTNHLHTDQKPVNILYLITACSIEYFCGREGDLVLFVYTFGWSLASHFLVI